ncbi:hypothetical protein [Roseobacter weihaiensis]|uniref:hypothetical protein n=1 Tax=Roseobacter weihaiensis TaxID=2763262 RepID=UPI001D0B5C84|nr:hypothetical protein [Roseobacter sp. H9]
MWKQYGRDKWRRKRQFEKLDSTFYGRVSLSIQAAQLQRASGDAAFKDVGLSRLAWVNLRNAKLRNATIQALEKNELKAFKKWYDRPLNQCLEKLRQARSKGYRDLYAKLQEERADLISRQKMERGDLNSKWRDAGRQAEREARQKARSNDVADTKPLLVRQSALRPHARELRVFPFLDLDQGSTDALGDRLISADIEEATNWKMQLERQQLGTQAVLVGIHEFAINVCGATNALWRLLQYISKSWLWLPLLQMTVCNVQVWPRPALWKPIARRSVL